MIGGIIVTFVAVLVAVAVALCAGGVIPRNSLVGIRGGSFLESDEAWRRGHRRALPFVAVAGVICIGVALAAALARWNEPLPTLLVAVVLLAGTVAGAIHGSRMHRVERSET